MKNFIITLLLICLTGLLNISCKPYAVSDLEWGLLKSHARSAILLKVPPKGQVSVCPNGSDEVAGHIAKAILTWAKEINRDEYMEVNTNCNKDANVRITVRKSNAGTASSDYINGIITYNVNSPQHRGFGTMLHEVGHAWGLCDQYSGPFNCANILGHANQNLNGKSVMASSIRTVLTEDDIEGIRYVANLEGVAQNDAWKDFLSSEGKIPVNLPRLYLKANGNAIDIYISTYMTLSYCVGDRESCDKSSNQRNLDTQTLQKAGKVYKISYLDPSKITDSAPLNLYRDGKLIRSVSLYRK